VSRSFASVSNIPSFPPAKIGFPSLFACKIARPAKPSRNSPRKYRFYLVAWPLLNFRRMNVSMYQAAAALHANTQWQEAIADNLASSSIPGFKKQELSFGAVESDIKTRPASRIQSAVKTNFNSGELKYTGVNTDVALEGKGFLQVQLPDGTVGYTRDGELHLSATGQLVTKQGYPVLGEGGPIQFDVSNPMAISISSTGEISQGSDLKGKLQTIEFENPNLLTQIGHGCFLANNPNVKSAPSETTTFHQGYVESANTSVTMEMAHLITSMRGYEANSRVIQMQDERLGKAISELSS
jgi:flagellar basal-body rod protein FlgF